MPDFRSFLLLDNFGGLIRVRVYYRRIHILLNVSTDSGESAVTGAGWGRRLARE